MRRDGEAPTNRRGEMWLCVTCDLRLLEIHIVKEGTKKGQHTSLERKVNPILPLSFSSAHDCFFLFWIALHIDPLAKLREPILFFLPTPNLTTPNVFPPCSQAQVSASRQNAQATQAPGGDPPYDLRWIGLCHTSTAFPCISSPAYHRGGISLG